MKRIHYDPTTKAVTAYTNNIATEENPEGHKPPDFGGDYIDVDDDVAVELGYKLNADGKTFAIGRPPAEASPDPVQKLKAFLVANQDVAALLK